MNNINELIEILYSKDNKTAYKCLKLLQSESEESNDVYKFFDTFVEMIGNTNSYISLYGVKRILQCF